MSDSEPEEPASGCERSSPELVPKISRRRFARRALAMTAASVSSGSALLGAGHEFQEQAPETPPKDEAGLSPEELREAEARLASVIRDYGDRLSGDQRRRLRRILLYNEKMLGSIRSFQLGNGDPPASVLKNFGVAGDVEPAGRHAPSLDSGSEKAAARDSSP